MLAIVAASLIALAPEPPAATGILAQAVQPETVYVERQINPQAIPAVKTSKTGQRVAGGVAAIGGAALFAYGLDKREVTDITFRPDGTVRDIEKEAFSTEMWLGVALVATGFCLLAF